CPPRGRDGQERQKDGVKKRCHSPSHRPAPLHHTQRFPPMFGADGFAQENGSRGPLTAETKPQKRASGEQLLVVLRNARKKSKDRKPQDRNLQRPDPPKPIGNPTCEPPAERRRQPRPATKHAS